MTDVITWSGWIGGIAIGLYGLFQFSFTGRLLGISTAYGNICSYLSSASFFHTGNYVKPNNWRLWFLIGIPLGGWIAAMTSPGEIVVSMSLGQLYDSVLPTSIWAKTMVLFFGGIMIGFGSRGAGGCPSGHSITGLSLLNPPSLLASAGFFVGGTIIVQLMFNLF